MADTAGIDCVAVERTREDLMRLTKKSAKNVRHYLDYIVECRVYTLASSRSKRHPMRRRGLPDEQSLNDAYESRGLSIGEVSRRSSMGIL